MTTNPEVSKATENSPEVQQVLESTKAGTDALKDEISTISSTKTELNWLGKFFSKLGDAWKELKEWNISKAIAILFGTDQQESQQTSSTSSSESSESSTTTTTWNESTTTSTTWTDNNETANTPSESKEKERNDGKVSIEKYIPGIKYDLKYATKDNSFWWKIMYKKPASEYLRMTEDAAKKLSKAQEILKKQWYELKIWDAFRDHDAQMMLRNNYKGPDTPGNPKSNNVAIPVGVNYFHPGQKVRKKWTWSHHWSWKAIDLTLVDSKWNELEMPTKFDDFSWKAKWDSVNKLPKNDPKRKNAYILRNAMEQAWLYAIWSEWWHYQTNKPKHSAPRA